MKAVIYEQYGSPGVLQLKEVDKPAAKAGEVLIRIYATPVCSGDVRMRKADPFAVRLMLGLRRPRRKIPGLVFAGEIEAVGQGVTRFKPGDKVYGTSMEKFSTYAEYISLSERAIIDQTPGNLSFSEAAAIPFGALSALHFLRTARISEGRKVLIYGASGAVGTAAVQLAKYFGAEVTAVCSTDNVSLVRSLGADRVIDYKNEDFSKNGQQYDIIFDAVGKSPFGASVRSLKAKGYYLRIVHLSLLPILRGLGVSLTTNKKVVGGTGKETIADLEFLSSLVEAGKLKPVIDRTYPLAQIQDAHHYVEQGHKKGNVIVVL